MTRSPFLLALAFLSLSAFAQGVTIAFDAGGVPPGAKVIVANATVTNHLDTDLQNVSVVTQLGYGMTAVLAGQSDAVWSCGHNGTLQSVRCTAAVLPAKQATPLTLYIDALHGRYLLQTTATWGEHGYAFAGRYVFAPFELHVTHDGDDGEGSLREVLHRANEECDWLKLACRIVFDAPMIIRPLTSLPPIAGDDVEIDGAGRVTLDGSQLFAGHGLEYTGLFAPLPGIRGLTIRNFPWDGLHVDRKANYDVLVEDCTVEGNGSRGITTEGESELLVRSSRIRGNARSGVFALGPGVTIEDSEIEDNGASGVFLHQYNALVQRNRIRGNAQFGVAVSRQVATVEVRENSISGNGISGIDRGLDGFDGYRYDENALHAAYIPPPRITGADYDAASNTTTIRGTYFKHDSWGTWSIEIFSSSTAEAQGETFLGRTGSANGEFSLVVPGDLRGRFITATGFRKLFLGWSGDWWWTSEFAEVVEVR